MSQPGKSKDNMYRCFSFLEFYFWIVQKVIIKLTNMIFKKNIEIEKVEAVSIEILFASADVTKTGFCCLSFFAETK